MLNEIEAVLEDNNVELRLAIESFISSETPGIILVTDADFDEFATYHYEHNPDRSNLIIPYRFHRSVCHIDSRNPEHSVEHVSRQFIFLQQPGETFKRKLHHERYAAALR